MDVDRQPAVVDDKTVDKTVDDKTADKTDDDKTADKTDDDKTADKTVDDKTADKTVDNDWSERIRLPTSTKSTNCANNRCKSSGTIPNATGRLRCADCVRLRVPADFSSYCSASCLTADIQTPAHAVVHASLFDWKPRLIRMLKTRQSVRRSAYIRTTKTGRLQTKTAIDALTIMYIEPQTPIRCLLFAGKNQLIKPTHGQNYDAELIGFGQTMELALQVLCFVEAFVIDDVPNKPAALPIRTANVVKLVSPFPQFTDADWSRAVAHVQAFSYGEGNFQNPLQISPPPIAFLNHSCWPNSVLRIDDTAVAICSIRPIPAGGELTVSYLPSLLVPRVERQATVLDRWRFVCGCQRCTDDTKTDAVDALLVAADRPIPTPTADKITLARRWLLSATTDRLAPFLVWLKRANAFSSDFGLALTHHEVCRVRSDAISRMLVVLSGLPRFPSVLRRSFHTLIAETVWSNAQLLPPFEVNKIHMIRLAVDVVLLGCQSMDEDIPFVDIAAKLAGGGDHSKTTEKPPPAIRRAELAATGQVRTRARVKAKRAGRRFALRVVSQLDPNADILERFADAPLLLGPVFDSKPVD